MGTNTQTAEPRVQVQVYTSAPETTLPNGFYAARVWTDEDHVLCVDAAKIPNLIQDLRLALIELTAQAQVDKAGVTAPAADDAQLLADLESEVPVTLSAPAFSGAISAAAASSGNYRMIWEVLNDAESPTWAQLSDTELRAIIRDYRHTVDSTTRHCWNMNGELYGLDREYLTEGAKAIFVGRSAEVEASFPEMSQRHLIRQIQETTWGYVPDRLTITNPAAGGDA